MILALALMQAVTAPQPGTPVAEDARVPVSLWVGHDAAGDFAFGDAIARALKASTEVRQASDVRSAPARIVVRRLKEAKRGAAFGYAVDLVQRGAKRERVVATTRGRCARAAIDGCAARVVTALTRRLGRANLSG